ncbi:MAG: outer membrane protein assembly factor BamA, partial [Gammaproteobacteria bacterium]|nr:outer membrane protein assembly factor BamA [Gammaproteobacteria bacterium]
MRGIVLVGAFALLFATFCARADSFTVDQIEVVGARKISIGTVLNYLPINVGEVFEDQRSAELIRELYSTGFFEYIELLQDGNTLVIKVRERPSIAEINIEGNDEIDDEVLDQALDQVGMTRGRIFNELQLTKLELELQQLYYSLGKYAVKLEAKWRSLDEDRIAIDINISEGEPALIRSINITGNNSFEEEDLLDEFQLETSDSGWFASDQYASSKLTGDLEKLRSFYLDQGYVKFNVDSKQVSISPDRKDINISVNVTEGEQFTLKNIDLAGELVVDKAELMALLLFREGEIFSRKKVTRSITLIQRRLGEEGYAFAEVRAMPELNEENDTVNLRLLVKPGKKIMVRFIKFSGNDGTRDIVLRREMRQMEGEIYRTSKVDRSRTRLQRLNFLGSVDLRTVRVEGHDDKVDLEIVVTERFSGNFTIGLGYSQSQGANLILGLTHDNIFGTGNSFSVNFDNSDSTQSYGFAYNNPFYTADGISRGFKLSFTKTDAAEENISNYLIDRYQLSMNYGIPLSEYNRLRLEFGLMQNNLTLSSSAANEVFEYVIANSDEYDSSSSTADIDDVEFASAFGSMSLSKDTRNRRIFADNGHLNSIKLELYGGDLEYYKLRYQHQSAFSVTDELTYNFKSKISYGDSYGETTGLPFFENFTAGGVRSVRGYEQNSLGPLD